MKESHHDKNMPKDNIQDKNSSMVSNTSNVSNMPNLSNVEKRSRVNAGLVGSMHINKEKIDESVKMVDNYMKE